MFCEFLNVSQIEFSLKRDQYFPFSLSLLIAIYSISSYSSRVYKRHNAMVIIHVHAILRRTSKFDFDYRSWYAYVVELCIKVVESKVEVFFLLVFYHICYIFLLWSYYKTIFTPQAIVPAPFKISRSELDQLFKIKNPDEQTRLLKHLAADLPVLNCTINNCVRFCEKCQHIKPDRAHHCSVCNVCNLKMGE